MSTLSTRRPQPRYCYGVMLHRHTGWWLVEFPKRGSRPIAAHRLTGNLTLALTDHLMQAVGGTNTACDTASLAVPSSFWSGEFTLVPSQESANRFDIGGQVGGAEASELEARLARAMVDCTLFPLPLRFNPVFSDLPREDVPVLAIRLSGHRCATFDLLTARYMPTYRPRSPWRDLSNDAVTDSGGEVLGWTSARDWIRPA